MTSEATTGARAARAASVVAIVVLVVTAAGLVGPVRLRGRAHGAAAPSPPPAPPRPVPSPAQTDAIHGRWLPALNVAVGTTIALYALVVLVLLVLAIATLRVRVRRRARRGAPAPGDGTEAGDDLVAPVVAGAVEAARLELRPEIPPGDAVVAAWLALERGAEASGVRREPAQTATELTVAVLDRTQADPAATRGLLDVYLRSRYSSHAVTAADVEAARAFLATIAAGLVRERADA